MKSFEELKKLYENELKPQLAGMEDQRKFIKKWRNLGIAAAVIIFLTYQLGEGFMSPTMVIITLVIFAIAGIYCAIKAYIRYQDYKKVFKTEVVEKIVKLINADYKYNPSAHIKEQFYSLSGIFPADPDRCSGDDLITGTIEQAPFQFSELKTEEKTESRDDDGSRKTQWNTIFRGIFFVAEFNKQLGERTFVMPQNDRRTTNIFGKERKKNRLHGEMVKLENPEFERLFTVYGSSQQEARYVLTPVLMEAIVNIQKQLGLKMYFSFVGENVYCAIPMGKNMFEPKISKDGINYKDVEEMFLLFSLIETIIHEMNLNTRIWTKA